MRAMVICVGFIAVLAGRAGGAEIPTRGQLTSALADQETIEDFEGISLAGGSVAHPPNPFSSLTPGWTLQPGVTYATTTSLTVAGTAVQGDDSLFLYGIDDLTITFNALQKAVGFDLIDQTGNVDYNDVVTFYRGSSVVGSVNRTLSAASYQFVGWQDNSGISRIVVTSSETTPVINQGVASIDNLAWGVTAVPEPTVFAAILPLMLGLRRRR